MDTIRVLRYFSCIMTNMNRMKMTIFLLKTIMALARDVIH